MMNMTPNMIKMVHPELMKKENMITKNTTFFYKYTQTRKQHNYNTIKMKAESTLQITIYRLN